MPDTYIRPENLLEVQQSITDFPRRAKEVTRQWGRELAYAERDMIRRNIRSRTGRTAQYGVRVFEATQGEKGYFFIRLNQVVQWLETGTGIYGPHAQLIYPRRAKVLRFEIGGRVLFRPYVRGMQAQRVISGAQNEMAAQMPRRIQDLTRRIKAVW